MSANQFDKPAQAFDLNWPYAHGAPSVDAVFRSELEDFCVDEELGFAPCGEGEHVYLQVRKRGDNTDWVARQIARLAGVQPMDVGYCGLKDRRAVTTQWFSVYLPIPKAAAASEPEWRDLNSDSVTVLQVCRHRQKLRRGAHRGNRFEIRLRDLSTPVNSNRLERVFQQGVPNYFGEQRFGHDGNNLAVAEALLTGERRIKNRQKRGLMLSAARSFLFNRVLAQRVTDDSWQQCLPGDVQASHPTGPLWGRGRPLVAEQTLTVESAVLTPWQHWCEGLEHVGLVQERRNLCLQPESASWHTIGGDLILRFSLPPGTYATAVLREIAHLHIPDTENTL